MDTIINNSTNTIKRMLRIQFIIGCCLLFYPVISYAAGAGICWGDYIASESSPPSGFTKSEICNMAGVHEGNYCTSGWPCGSQKCGEKCGVDSYFRTSAALTNPGCSSPVCLQNSSGNWFYFAVSFMKYCCYRDKCKGKSDDCGGNPTCPCKDQCFLSGWTNVACAPPFVEVMRVRCPGINAPVKIGGSESNISPLKIRKNNRVYSVALVDNSSDPNASCVRIKIGTATKYLRKIP